MRFKGLKHNYHDGLLLSYTLGPRRELTIEVKLDHVWNQGAPAIVSIRFGAIKNYDHVRHYFSNLRKSQHGDFIGEIVGIVYEHKGKWIVDTDQYDSVTIASDKVAET